MQVKTTTLDKGSLIAILMIVAGSLVSCKKTIVNPLPEQPDNRIIAYKVVNVQGDPVYGAINEKEGIITVNIPSYLQLILLEPEIKTDEGASVTPESGTLIENLPEVFLNKRTVSYTVKGKSGISREYKLNIQVQQPDVVLDELTTDPASPRAFTKRAASILSITLTGSGFNENKELMYGELLTESGEVLGQLGRSSAAPDTKRQGFYISDDTIEKFGAPLPATGLYRIRVYNYARQATLVNPIRINIQ